MAGEDDFDLWLGRIGRDKPLTARLRIAGNRVGRQLRAASGRAVRFNGARLGRGSGVGRVLASGDRHAGFRARRVVVKTRIVKLAGKGGLSRYVDIGTNTESIPDGSIVRIEPRSVGARDVDRTIAKVGAANGGHYSVDAHLRHDLQATEAFAQKHVRRLEAIRRTTGAVERRPHGSWTIAPDHLDRVEAYERAIARNSPVAVEVLSAAPLDKLPGHDGATWLDRELTSTKPTRFERGFGGEVRAARPARQQWLVEQELAQVEGDRVRVAPNLVVRLQQRELGRVAGQLSRELGLAYTPATSGEKVAGKLARAVQIGDRKFALIERSREFTLVPWRPVLERAVGKQVAGIVRETGIDWTIGRERAGPQIGEF